MPCHTLPSQTIAEPFGAETDLAISWYLEELTDSIEEDAKKYFKEIEKLGGVIECIETGYLQKEISESSSDYQSKIENKERIIVGMTDFIKEDEEIEIPILEIRKEVENEQNDRLIKLKQDRNNELVNQKLIKIQESCKNGENLVPVIIDAVESYATLGEIVDAMKDIFGEWTEKAVF